jgi:hypothetical protein
VLKKGQRIRMMGPTHLRRRPRRRVHAQDDRRRRARPRRDRLHHRRDQGGGRRRVGDTITDERKPTAEPLPGFKPAQPVVFCGLFPVDAADFEDLRAAMGKLRSTTPASPIEMETSRGARLRLPLRLPRPAASGDHPGAAEREFNLDLIATAPSVIYKITLTDGEVIELHNPADMPDPVKIEEIAEPWIKATILTPDEYLGSVLKLCQDRRGAARAHLRRQPRHGGLRPAAQRGGVRFLRPAEIDLQGLRLVRLSPRPTTSRRPGQDADPGQRRAGRRAVDAGAPHPRRGRGRAWSRR